MVSTTLGSLFVLLSWIATRSEECHVDHVKFLASSHNLVSCTLVLSCINELEHRDASVLVLRFLMHQNSWLTSWGFSQKLGKLEKFKFEIHGVLSDAGILHTCCVTNEQ